MIVRFRGVRGSYSRSLRPRDLKRKISAAVQRVKPDNLANPESRELFLHSLPETVFGTVGGHTACIEIRLDDQSLLIFDCGSGLRTLDEDMRAGRESPEMIHIFFSHFHYDHISGLPYFSYFFDRNVKFRLYSPQKGFEEILSRFLSKPYHPVGIETFSASIEYIELKGESIRVGDSVVSWIVRNHPDECYAYSVKEKGKRVIYSTDTELTDADFRDIEKTSGFFYKADAIILDGQYTLGESIEKFNWGHTSYSLSVDFALEHKIDTLYLFHHDPQYDDNKLEAILRSSRWYCERAEKRHPLRVELAREDSEVEF
ncbi:MAG: MBL fold metallo-hydrolase [Spirochaetales bacterium]|nr:MBL fold metallo-hydrolase [Spirochaetales bacterium]